MPFFRQRPQGLRKQPERAHFQCRFAAFRNKACSFRADEITNVQQAKKIHQLRANFFCVYVDLNAAGGIAHVEEVAFSHVAMRRDAARRTKRLAFFKLTAYLGNRSACLKTRTERIDTLRAKRLEFLAAQRDQLIFFFHDRKANVRRRRKMNSLNNALKG